MTDRDDLLARADRWINGEDDTHIGHADLLIADLAERVQAFEAALRAIAEPDVLLNANEEAFGGSAARRMQAQAQAALVGSAPSPAAAEDTA